MSQTKKVGKWEKIAHKPAMAEKVTIFTKYAISSFHFH